MTPSERSVDRLWSGYAGAIASLVINLLFVVATLLIILYVLSGGMGYQVAVSRLDARLESEQAIQALNQEMATLRAEREGLVAELDQVRAEAGHSKILVQRLQRALRQSLESQRVLREALESQSGKPDQ